MKTTFISRLSAAVAFLLVTATGAAHAQRYDGGGLLKFGIFGQAMSIDYGFTQPGTGSFSADGMAGGLSLGFDVANSNGFLYGIEVDGSIGDMRTTALGTSIGFDYLATLRARGGYYMHPNLLLYGTGGMAFLGIEAQRAPANLKAYETLMGWTLGAGLEWNFHHTLLFTEYLYANFDSRAFTVNAIRHETDADVHMLRFGIKFKTGHDFDHGSPRDRYEPMK